MLYTTATSMYRVYVEQQHSSSTASRDNYLYAGSHINRQDPGDARMWELHHLHVMS
jgi:hypothetical protein